MLIKAFRKLLIECFIFLVLLAIFNPLLKQITNQANSMLMEIGAPAGMELNVKDLLLNPGRSEKQMVDEFIQLLNNL